MELRKINKKGGIEDLFFFMVTLLGLAILIIIVAYTIPKVMDGLKETDLNNTQAVRDAFLKNEDIIDKLDPVYLIVFSGLIMSMLIVSFFIDSHPVFIPIYMILLGFAIAVGVITNHVYDEFASAPDFAAVAAEQVYMVNIMNNFVLILLGVGILSMIILFAKPFRGTRL